MYYILEGMMSSVWGEEGGVIKKHARMHTHVNSEWNMDVYSAGAHSEANSRSTLVKQRS